MPLTEDQWKQLVLTEVGDDAAGTLAANLDLYWEKHGTIDDFATRYLVVKRDAIDLLLGRVRKQVDFASIDGASVKLKQLFDNLLAMRELVESQLAAAGGDSGVSSDGTLGAIGQLPKTSPIMPPMGALDANSPAYRGSPYHRRRR